MTRDAMNFVESKSLEELEKEREDKDEEEEEDLDLYEEDSGYFMSLFDKH